MDSLPTHSRRALLGAGIAVAGSGLLAASSAAASSDTGPDGRHDGHDGRDGHGDHGSSRAGYVEPNGPEVSDAERRRGSGPVRKLYVDARKSRIDIGSRTVDTWTYGDRLPGKEVRITAGDTLAVTLVNHLPQSTTLHWHGMHLRNDMDGVPDVTQRAVKPGGSYLYSFRVTQPGTFWMHPHVGVQQDHGLYAPLIVDDPKEPMSYDKEWVVVLDDWLDGVDGSNPDTVLKDLNHGRDPMAMDDDGDGGGGSHGGGHGHGSGHDGSGHDSGHGRDHGHGPGHGHRHDGHGSGHGHGEHGRHGDHSGRGDHDYPRYGMPLTSPMDIDELTEDFRRGLDFIRDGLDLGFRAMGGFPDDDRLMDRASRGAFRAQGPMPGNDGPNRLLRDDARSSLLGAMPGNINYPYHLINGRTNRHPETFHAKPGDRIRIRFINAGGDTAYRVALGGHDMTVTHTDGNPVQHARAGALLIGMAERYDVVVTARSGVFPLVALAEGKGRSALAVLRTASGEAPDDRDRPKALDGHVMTADKLRAPASVRARSRRPDRVLTMRLTGNMTRFNWAFNGRPYTPSQRYPLYEGERVRLVFRNGTKMWHPVHLHGHSFTLPDGGPLKDTMIMRPGENTAVEFDADNPGLWMLHCHNIYHSESGMMTVLGYRRK
ncbi:hypothetical protein GCM10010211_17400 [Streptomyces albospinus]|uniref:Multicopper oxidase n=1 Tax=Streptomyces albospinus TaxID=285515 RepID=A0ABQ2UWL3_9ACTN|nr:multicopper oxidase family protein [Streptomyces albospinus]GGU53242.1 hypothetical protein GCM10010211_17400 [Streptomyces albospinus]